MRQLGEDGEVIVSYLPTRSRSACAPDVEPLGLELALGFPFPVVARRTETHPARSSAWRAHRVMAHGPKLARELRLALIRQLEAHFGAQVSWCREGALATRLWAALRLPDTALVYVDPFRFVGDSVSHLANRDVLADAKSWTVMASVAGNAAVRSLPEFTHATLAEAIADVRQNASGVVGIVPNYIDDQWGITRRAIIELLTAFPRGCVAVPGRSLMAARPGPESHVEILSTPGEPSLLSDLPVEMTQDIALKGLGLRRRRRPAAIPSREVPASGPVVIAPLASATERSIPAEVIEELVPQLVSDDRAPELLLGPAGDVRSDSLMEQLDMDAVQPLAGLDLATAARRISEARLCVAADSFAAHLSVRHGVPSTVLYSQDCLDLHEPLTLLHHSALGFCSDFPLQFPCMLSSLSTPSDADWTALSQHRELLAFLSGRSVPTDQTVAIARSFVESSRAILESGSMDLDRLEQLWAETVAEWTAQPDEPHAWVWSWFDPTEVVRVARRSGQGYSEQLPTWVGRAILISPTAKMLKIVSRDSE